MGVTADQFLDQRASLARNDLGGPKIDVLNNAIVIEKDICTPVSLELVNLEDVGRLTLRLDVTVGNVTFMQISQSLQELQGIHHDDLFVFNTTMF